jgi:hypothetical protein
MSKGKMTWVLEDHLCRHCGGRILRCVSGGGPTGGGNPLYKCASCGLSGAAYLPAVLCWCGFKHRGNAEGAYRCLPFSLINEHPRLREAFLAAGCDPAAGEVGVVLRESARKAMAS